MATLTVFDDWLSGVDSADYNDIYCLYNAVNTVDTHNPKEEWGAFNCTVKVTPARNMYFVKCSYFDDYLLLASDKARSAFLKHLEGKYASGMDMEVWYTIQSEKDKDD